MLSRAQRPLATALLVVRDEEAARFKSCHPDQCPRIRGRLPSSRGGHQALDRTGPSLLTEMPGTPVWPVPQRSTATVLIGGTPPACTALRWWPSSWRSHRSPTSSTRRRDIGSACSPAGELPDPSAALRTSASRHEPSCDRHPFDRAAPFCPVFS